ncbi:MAG: di-trans,poly-cis-decaprenylcistransferase [Rhodospirillaceae bacterium]|nr:di-trans,poly-cis-decaprenylcistransferase [Rhodospirillaceae bacterium]
MSSLNPVPKKLESIPVHVGIIMDGNGRWAEARNLQRIEGHRKGIETVKEIVKGSIELEIRYLTLYGFSTENWKRPSGEISFLMGQLRFFLRNEIKTLNEHGVRIKFIGYRGSLENDIVDLLQEAEEETKNNNVLHLVVALSYGARQEIAAAARRIATKVLSWHLDAEAINEDTFADYLETFDIPDPDLIIRTSGEQRISNFLLWQSAYAELVFIDTLWPDFSIENLKDALNEFNRRERRYGSTV